MLTAQRLVPLLVLGATTFCATEARAQSLPEMGKRGTLVIDQLSGFRASTIDGLSYAGPIGLSIGAFGEKEGGAKGTLHRTLFWLAPSADFFVIDHLSIGGLIELVTASYSEDLQANPNASTVSTSLPSSTSFTFLPRVGWMFGLGDRFGIWPRLGLGYFSKQSASTLTFGNIDVNSRDTVQGFLLDLDVNFLYRVNEFFFFKAAPEISAALGPTHSVTTGGATFTNDASIFQFAIVAGIGVMWDL